MTVNCANCTLRIEDGERVTAIFDTFYYITPSLIHHAFDRSLELVPNSIKHFDCQNRDAAQRDEMDAN